MRRSTCSAPAPAPPAASAISNKNPGGEGAVGYWTIGNVFQDPCERSATPRPARIPARSTVESLRTPAPSTASTSSTSRETSSSSPSPRRPIPRKPCWTGQAGRSSPWKSSPGRDRPSCGSGAESDIPGTLGGYRRSKDYGCLDCPSALRAIAQGGYVRHRVFFAAEEVAIAAGYRLCGTCLRPKNRHGWQTPSLERSSENPSQHCAPTVKAPVRVVRKPAAMRAPRGVMTHTAAISHGEGGPLCASAKGRAAGVVVGVTRVGRSVRASRPSPAS